MGLIWEGMLHKMYIPAPSTGFNIYEIAPKFRDYLKLVPSQQNILKSKIGIGRFLNPWDISYIFKAAAYLKRTLVSTLTAS